MKQTSFLIDSYTYEDSNLQKELSAVLVRPLNKVNLPVVIYIHGHVTSDKKALYSPISSPPSPFIWHWLARRGFAVFMPVMLGYGKAGGESDYCGPKTISGILTAINDVLLKEETVNKSSIAIYGISRGANVTAQILTKSPELFRCGILQSGFYDAKSSFDLTKIEGIREIFRKEAGTDERSFRERSPIFDMEKLQCPVLILHGEKDDRVDVSEAKNLDETLTKLGKPHKTIIFPEKDHYLTLADVGKDMMKFIEGSFK